MTTIDLEYVSEQFERETEMSMRPGERKFRAKKRPTYMRKRTPVRLGIKRRNNQRRSIKF